MELIEFTCGDRTERLRPTHAIKLAAELKGAIPGEGAIRVPSEMLADAARRVRDQYRCRTVRTELRRLSLMADDASADGIPIDIASNDAAALEAMVQAAA